MRLITCSRCNSQFDVASMTPGTSFVCGKCRNVLQVPQAGPVVQPISSPPPRASVGAPPATVALTPDQVRKALAASKDVGAARAAPAPAAVPAGRRAEPPATTALTPEQTRAALEASRKLATDRQAAAAAPATPAERKLPKAMQQRAAQAAQAAPQRAGGPPPAAEAPPQNQGKKKSKPAKPARAPAARGGEKKSNTAVLAGAGLGVVVLGAAAFFLLRGGDGGGSAAAGNGNGTGEVATGGGNGGGATPAAGGGGTGTTPAKPAVDPSDPVAVFLAMSSTEQKDEVGRRVREAIGSDMNLRAAYDFFAQERFAGNAAAKLGREMACESALREDPSSAWANEASGRHDLLTYLRACMSDCPKAFEFSDEDELKIQQQLAEVEKAPSPWVDAKTFKEIQPVVERVRQREEALKTDTRLIAVEKQKDWVRKNDLFKDLKRKIRFDDPYVIIQQYKDFSEAEIKASGASLEAQNLKREEKAAHFAKRDGIIFQELNRQFRKLFAERFNLPELQERGRLLRVLILWDRETFDEWHRRQNSGISGFVRAYYSPTERHIVHYVGTESLTDTDLIYCANGRVQKEADSTTFHEGTHQLMHEYAAIFQGNALPNDPGQEAQVPPRVSMWFDEGHAEFMGAVEVDEKNVENLDGEFFHNRLLVARIPGARYIRKNRMPLWPLSELILPNHNGEMTQKAGELFQGNVGLGASQFYFQAWALVHFAWYYDNGKYRSNLLDYMEKVLKNEHGPDAFVKCFKLPSKTDFGDFEKEFAWYYDQILARPVGRKGDNGPYYRTNTDPPTGTWDPNASTGDYDDE